MRIIILGGGTTARAIAGLDIPAWSWEQAESCPEALALMRSGGFDAVVIETQSAGAALGAIQNLRASAGRKGSELPIMVVQSSLQTANTAQLLNAGADDVVAPSCGRPELQARLRAAIRRSQGFARPALAYGPLTLDAQTQQAWINGAMLHLTSKEFTILETLLLRRERVISRAALFDRLHDAADAPDEKSLDVLICRLRKKLAAAGAPKLISTAWGNGFVLRLHEPSAMPQPVAA